MAQPDALLAQLGGPPAGAPEAEPDLMDDEFEADSEVPEEELELLMADFDDTSLPVSERVAALRAALGV